MLRLVVERCTRQDAKYCVSTPDDLAAALAAAPAALATYQRLPLPAQREYLRWLSGAKTPERRAERLRETVARLERGLKRG